MAEASGSDRAAPRSACCRAAQDHPPVRLLFGTEVSVRQPEAGLARSELGTLLALSTAGITRILTAAYSVSRPVAGARGRTPCEVINTVTHMGYQFLGGSGPGRRAVW